MQLNKVKALITGGVSGLGLAVARKVVSSGGQAVLLDINDEAGAAVEAELGSSVSYIRTDVTSEQGVTDAVKQAVDHMGLINVAVNCAGIIGAGRVLGREATADEAPTILDEYANTSSAGSVIAFHKHHDDFNSGELGVLCSFGAGYSIGSVILKKL